MLLRSCCFFRVCLVCAAIAGGACSSNEQSAAGRVLPHFDDVATAPAKIQDAAKAVVRIYTVGQGGTGSFISSTGLLLTNNHVLGDTVCPLEGCHITISLLHQRGQPRLDSTAVFAVPLAVDVGLDMAVAQLYDQPGGTKFGSPDYLQINAKEPRALLGMPVTIVGHPKGCLKKWTDGYVVDTSGKWFTSTVYTLPGSSGSPVLDENGMVVGLLHRGPTAQDLYTDDGVNVFSIGTASGPISAALNKPLPNTMLAVTAATTKDAFISNDLVYLNGRVGTVTVDSVSRSALSLLGEACDGTLARTDFKSPDDLSASLVPCYHGSYWIECRTDSGAYAQGTSCPSAEDAAKWVGRNQAVNKLWANMNGVVDYYSVSFAIASLQSTRSNGIAAGAHALQQAVGVAKPVLDFWLAYYLAAFNIGSYQGSSIPNYIVNYAKVPYYELSAKDIAYAATWLASNGLMSESELLVLLKNLLEDPKVSVGAQLAIENVLYERDWL